MPLLIQPCSLPTLFMLFISSPQDAKRSRHHHVNVSWLRRTEYISTEPTRFQPQTNEKIEATVGFATRRKQQAVSGPLWWLFSCIPSFYFLLCLFQSSLALVFVTLVFKPYFHCLIFRYYFFYTLLVIFCITL